MAPRRGGKDAVKFVISHQTTLQTSIIKIQTCLRNSFLSVGKSCLAG